MLRLIPLGILAMGSLGGDRDRQGWQSFRARVAKLISTCNALSSASMFITELFPSSPPRSEGKLFLEYFSFHFGLFPQRWMRSHPAAAATTSTILLEEQLQQDTQGSVTTTQNLSKTQLLSVEIWMCRHTVK